MRGMKSISIEKMIRREIVRLKRQKAQVDRRLHTLEKILLELEVSEYTPVGLETAGAALSLGIRARKMGANQMIIASILTAHNGPMAIREIANQAYQTGRIKSANGYRGVYAIVQTILRRNGRTTFIKTGPGEWDLRERHAAENEKRILRAVASVDKQLGKKAQPA